MTVKLKSKAINIPNFVHNRYSTEYQPRDYLADYKPLAAIYLLRFTLGMSKQLTAQDLHRLFRGEPAKLTGLTRQQASITQAREDDLLDVEVNKEDSSTATKHVMVKAINQRLRQIIKQGMQVNTPLCKNLKRLAEHFGLTETDQEIIVISSLLETVPSLREIIDSNWLDMSDDGLCDCLHLLTVRPIADLKNSLALDSPLRKLNLLSNKLMIIDLSERLSLNQVFSNRLWEEHDSIESMVNRCSETLPTTGLPLQTDAQLKTDLDVLVPYLQAALASKQAGVNILVHAGAGAESVALVNAVCQNLGASLVKINDTAEYGQRLFTQSRFSNCQLVQECLSRQPGQQMMMIDKAEDIFEIHDDFAFMEENYHELNKIDPHILAKQLQTNPVPIFWLFNRPPSRFKPELFKQFSYTWRIDKIPASLRQQLIRQATEGLKLSDEVIRQLANQSDIRLEEISSAAAVARVSGQCPTSDSEKLMLNTLNAKRSLFGKSPVQRPVQHHTGYDLKFTNTSTPLPELIAGLRQSQRGNLCFYGAPGTGKTAFAQHIAEQLGLPLLVKRASDLIDKYVGESEKNIAHMFQQAERQGAILLLDEADSLLSDRRDAHRSWEITQVNEMLTQMERFNGIFICTTNLMAKLDTASLRRFDFKVQFDYLNPDQRWALFHQEAKRMGMDLANDAETLTNLKQQVQRLTQLTPGDFAVANRQAALLGKSLTPEQILAVLTQECEAKGERFGRIGFVH